MSDREPTSPGNEPHGNDSEETGGGGGDGRPERISADSSAYREHRERENAINVPPDLFGAKYLEAREHDEDIMAGKRAAPSVPFIERKRQEALQRLHEQTRRDFAALLGNDRCVPIILRDARDYFRERGMGRDRGFQLPDDANRVLEYLAASRMASSEAFDDFLEWRRGVYAAHAERMQAEFERSKGEFRERITRAGILPLLDDEIARRLSEARVRMIDPLVAELEETSGRHNPLADTIKIAMDLSPDERRRTSIHEMLHALGGRTMLADPRVPGYVEMQRKGLYFDAGDRFSWMDEALTETLTSLVAGEPTEAYPDERKLLEYLRTRGSVPIPLEYFINAYVEDYRPDRGTETGVPAWKRLHGAIRTAFGEGFLVALDDAVREKGVREIAKQLEAGWRPTPSGGEDATDVGGAR